MRDQGRSEDLQGGMTWHLMRRATPTSSAAYHFTYMLPRENRAVIEPYNEKGVPFEHILPIGEAHT